MKSIPGRGMRTTDSLAETYANGGQSDLAILSYRQSLALNPKNTAAAAFLVKALGMTPLPK